MRQSLRIMSLPQLRDSSMSTHTVSSPYTAPFQYDALGCVELPRSLTAVTDRAAHLSCASLNFVVLLLLFKYLSCRLVNLVVVLPDVPG